MALKSGDFHTNGEESKRLYEAANLLHDAIDLLSDEQIMEMLHVMGIKRTDVMGSRDTENSESGDDGGEVYSPDKDGQSEDWVYDGEVKSKVTLAAHQLAAFRFCVTRSSRKEGLHKIGPCGCVVDMAVGLGKTLVALCVICMYKWMGCGPAVVVCPNSLTKQWIREIFRFFGTCFKILYVKDHSTLVMPVYGKSPELWNTCQMRPVSVIRNYDVVVIALDTLWSCWRHSLGGVTYKCTTEYIEKQKLNPQHVKKGEPEHVQNPVHTNLADRLQWLRLKGDNAAWNPIPVYSPAAADLLNPVLSVKWSVQVIDESHKIRNPDTERFMACRFLNVDHFSVMLTGTFILNKTQEMWTQLTCCRCADIPTYKEFSRICSESKRTEKVINSATLQRSNDAALIQDSLKPSLLGNAAQQLSVQNYKKKVIEKILTDHVVVIKPEDVDSRPTLGVNSKPVEPCLGESDSPSGKSVMPRDLDIVDDGGKSIRCVASDKVLTASEQTEESNVKFDKHWRLYSCGTADIPPAYCQNLELTPPDMLNSALEYLAHDINSTISDADKAKEVLRDMKESMKTADYNPCDYIGIQGKQHVVSTFTRNVFTNMSLMRQLSESWKYPTEHVSNFLTNMFGKTWNPNIQHPKPLAVAAYITTCVKKDEKVIVFCHFKGSVQDMTETLTSRGVMTLSMTGDCKKEVRESIIKKFLQDRTVKALVTTRIAEDGLNLQEANHVVITSTWWNGKQDEQAIGRVHRMGQKKVQYVTWFTLGCGRNSLYSTVESIMVDKCIAKQIEGREIDNMIRVFGEASKFLKTRANQEDPAVSIVNKLPSIDVKASDQTIASVQPLVSEKDHPRESVPKSFASQCIDMIEDGALDVELKTRKRSGVGDLYVTPPSVDSQTPVCETPHTHTEKVREVTDVNDVKDNKDEECITAWQELPPFEIVPDYDTTDVDPIVEITQKVDKCLDLPNREEREPVRVNRVDSISPLKITTPFQEELDLAVCVRCPIDESVHEWDCKNSEKSKQRLKAGRHAKMVNGRRRVSYANVSSSVRSRKRTGGSVRMMSDPPVLFFDQDGECAIPSKRAKKSRNTTIVAVSQNVVDKIGLEAVKNGIRIYAPDGVQIPKKVRIAIVLRDEIETFPLRDDPCRARTPRDQSQSPQDWPCEILPCFSNTDVVTSNVPEHLVRFLLD